MLYNPERHRRRTIRLKEYDYSQAGAYFITVCTKNRECLFGEIVDSEMCLNEWGEIVAVFWNEVPRHFRNVELDGFIVMPNHVHGILIIIDNGRGTACRAPTVERFGKPVANSLPTIIRSFKSATTKRINEIRATHGIPIWQRNYYEHIIRKEESLNCIREYIMTNPLSWDLDKENPHQKGEDEFDKWLKRQFIKGESNS